MGRRTADGHPFLRRLCSRVDAPRAEERGTGVHGSDCQGGESACVQEKGLFGAVDDGERSPGPGPTLQQDALPDDGFSAASAHSRRSASSSCGSAEASGESVCRGAHRGSLARWQRRHEGCGTRTDTRCDVERSLGSRNDSLPRATEPDHDESLRGEGLFDGHEAARRKRQPHCRRPKQPRHVVGPSCGARERDRPERLRRETIQNAASPRPDRRDYCVGCSQIR